MPIRLEVEVVQNPDPVFGEAEKVLKDLAEPTEAALDLIKQKVSKYPPKPAGSTYVRTGRLGRSWKPELVGSGGVLGRVKSVGGVAPYNVYVQDRKQQNQNLKHWQTAQDVAEQLESKIKKIYTDWLEVQIGGL